LRVDCCVSISVAAPPVTLVISLGNFPTPRRSVAAERHIRMSISSTCSVWNFIAPPVSQPRAARSPCASRRSIACAPFPALRRRRPAPMAQTVCANEEANVSPGEIFRSRSHVAILISFGIIASCSRRCRRAWAQVVAEPNTRHDHATIRAPRFWVDCQCWPGSKAFRNTLPPTHEGYFDLFNEEARYRHVWGCSSKRKLG
jgi:hypothetical protein